MKDCYRVYIKKDATQGQPRNPTRAYPGDAGWDLYVSRPAVIPPRSFVDVHTDVYIAMPEVLWGRITGRSSILRKRGLLVNEGVIDPGYRGELFIGVWNLREEPVDLQVGDRIAQLIFHHVVEISWCDVLEGELPHGVRNDRGFGSSGR